MKISAVPFEQLDTRTAYAVWKLRQDVFVVEQACPYSDLDGRDTESGAAHVLFREGADLIGYARVLEDQTTWRVGRVVLATSGRGRGLADGLMSAALRHCRSEDPARDVVLDAQTPLTDWYAGFGFAVDGEEFLEDGIPHLPMVRRAQ